MANEATDWRALPPAPAPAGVMSRRESWSLAADGERVGGRLAAAHIFCAIWPISNIWLQSTFAGPGGKSFPISSQNVMVLVEGTFMGIHGPSKKLIKRLARNFWPTLMGV